MTQIILDKAILQEVPEGAKTWWINFRPEIEFLNENKLPIAIISLPSGQYEILGLGSELGDDDFDGIVDEFECVDEEGNTWGYTYRDYEDKSQVHAYDYDFDSRTHSFASLLRSHNVQPETTLVILKK